MVHALRASVLAILVATSCAPRQELVITPHLTAGTKLSYGFQASVITTLSQLDRDTVRSTLSGIVDLEVLTDDARGTELRIRFTPTASTRDGEPTEPGPAQSRDVTLRPDGTVRADGIQQGQLGNADLQPELLATVLHPDVPSPLAEPGIRWETDSSSGQLVALDRSDGRDLAELLLRREVAVQRQRTLDGRPVDLDGIERSSTMLTWDLDDGIPTRAELHSSATLDVRAGALLGGTITIEATTSVRLLDQVR